MIDCIKEKKRLDVQGRASYFGTLVNVTVNWEKYAQHSRLYHISNYLNLRKEMKIPESFSILILRI